MYAYAKSKEKKDLKKTVQKKEKTNLTGIPDMMKMQFENNSGLSFDDVRVHYNSDKPAQLQALAYTQGSHVHVAPGQANHLPHELGHVVQQKKERVEPTTQFAGMNVNDNEMLEKEADSMARQATIQNNYQEPSYRMTNTTAALSHSPCVQMKVTSLSDYFVKKHLLNKLSDEATYPYEDSVNTVIQENGNTVISKADKADKVDSQPVNTSYSTRYGVSRYIDVNLNYKIYTPNTKPHLLPKSINGTVTLVASDKEIVHLSNTKKYKDLDEGDDAFFGMSGQERRLS